MNTSDMPQTFATGPDSMCPPAVPDAGEVEGLAEVIRTGLRKCRVEDAPAPLIKDNDLHHVTHMVTAEVRNWLAAHVAKAKAEALREAADELERAIVHVSDEQVDSGGFETGMEVGSEITAAALVRRLHDRADRIEGTR